MTWCGAKNSFLGAALVSALAMAATQAAAASGEEQMNTCLSRSDSIEQDRACMYLVYDDCQAAMDSGATNVLASCLSKEAMLWDAQLNAEWATVRANADARDAEDAGADGANVKALLAAQRAWIAYRDAECENTYQRYITGTIRSLMGGACVLEMTAERVFDFREWQRDWE